MTKGVQGFDRRGSETQQRRLSRQFKRHAWLGPPSDVRSAENPQLARANRSKTIYAGISSFAADDSENTRIAIAIRDPTYLLDFVVKNLESEVSTCAEEATEFVMGTLRPYMEKHLEKIVGIAMPTRVANHCTQLTSRLWAELDIIPLVLPESRLLDPFTSRGPSERRSWDSRAIDEQAESMARKCVR